MRAGAAAADQVECGQALKRESTGGVAIVVSRLPSRRPRPVSRRGGGGLEGQYGPNPARIAAYVSAAWPP